MDGNGKAAAAVPRGFESWRTACEAITGLSRYPSDKPGGPSRVRQYPYHAVTEAAEQMHLGRTKGDYKALEGEMDRYEENEEDKWKRGLVEQWKNELLRTSECLQEGGRGWNGGLSSRLAHTQAQ